MARQAKTLNQTGKMLESLEAKLRYQWQQVMTAKDQDQLSERRKAALETYQQVKKFKTQIGAA